MSESTDATNASASGVFDEESGAPEEEAKAAERQLAGELVELLEQKKATGPCPRCDEDKWAAEVWGLWVSKLTVKTAQLPPPMLPMLVLTCKNCGYALMYNAKALRGEL